MKVILICALALMLSVAGCLLSLQHSIVFNVPGPFHTEGTALEEIHVELEEESDWADHSDEIKRIESLRLDATVTNHNATAEALNVYMTLDGGYTTVAQVKSAGYPLVAGLPLVAGPGLDTLSLPEVEPHLQLSGDNFTHIKDLVKGGHFHLYFFSEDGVFDFTIGEVNVFVTFTAGS